MSHVRRLSITLVTDADGAATGYSDPIPAGLLSQIRYVKGNYSDGVDFTLTLETTGETLWTQSDVNASATVAPRQATHTTAGAASVFAGTDGVLDKVAIANDRIKVVVASGGDTKTGTFHFLLV